MRTASISLVSGCFLSAFLAVATTSGTAHAQDEPPPPPPERSDGWNTATNVLAATSLAIELVFPRVFYSDPEVTVGWKARWHLSALAPLMTLTTVTLFNEVALKDMFQGTRPGCDGVGTQGCGSYGFMSTQSFAAGSALGHGIGVFLIDTTKWSHGSVNVGGLIGEVGLPLILAPITIVGRTTGNWESGEQAWSSAAIGLGVGFALGAIYAALQRPECGYTGDLICW